MKFSLSIFLLFILFSIPFYSQQNDESWKLYDDKSVARIDITIPQSSLDWIYDNVQSDSLHLASFHFQNNYINEFVDSIGFRIRGNTSRTAQKKSFKISFNTFVDGREFYGVDKLNINGEHNDPSIIRSKLSFDLYKDIGMTASRAAHTQVYINGKYYGVYISVEHIDDEFLSKNFNDDTGNLWKCLYPADLVYKGTNPDLYKSMEGNRRTYELKTNEEEDDYSKLAELIEIINLTPDNLLADSLEKIFDVPGLLKYFAINILVGEWDDYWSNMNNYYIYHNPSQNKFQLIPYDYDNTFGIDWFNINWAAVDPYNFPQIQNGARPLATRVMNIAQYRTLYTHFLRFYKENVFKLSHWESRIDSLKNLITPYVLTDTLRTKDYNFTMNDFSESYSNSYSNAHVKTGIKEFINERYNSLEAQLYDINTAPIVYQINYSEFPSADDSIFITAAAYDVAGIKEVSIIYTPDGSENSTIFPMIFSPVANTKIVEESDRWIGTIPPLGAGASGSFKILVTDNDQLSVSYPRNNSIKIKTSGTAEALIINEFLASNSSGATDTAGEFEDWIEIFNPSPDDITISGMYLSDKENNIIKWKIPGDDLKIRAGEYLIIWCDEDQEQGNFHSNFKLSADGEFISLTSADGITIIDSLSFGEQTENISFGRSPDGSENWQFFNQPTPGSSNLITAIDDDIIAINSFNLQQNFPNPFNPVTSIQYAIGSRQFVLLKVYDVLGNEIVTLVNEEKNPGNYEVEFSAGYLGDGKELTSGIYFYTLRSGSFFETRKMMLIK